MDIPHIDQKNQNKHTTNIKHPLLPRSSQVTTMASSAPPSSTNGVQNTKKSFGLIANAMKRKDSFIQFFAMTGILMLSIRSLGQKYRIHDLLEDTSSLKQEQVTLSERMSTIKRDLLHEASLEPTGAFSSRLQLLFGDLN